MPEGKCKPMEFFHITEDFVDKILSELKSSGSDIKGNNPWTIYTHKERIILKAYWDEIEDTLKVIVLKKNFYVGCGMIRKKIEKLVQKLSRQIS